MKAYCINLDRRPDRLAHMTAEFARAGIPFERIPAVDGQDPEVAAAAARLPPYLHGKRISAGVHGCFESHRAAWRRLVESGDPWAMVFEDDLILASGLEIYQQESWIPAGADIVKLETYGVQVHVMPAHKMTVGARTLALLRSYHHGAGAYILSVKTAQRFLADTRPIGLPVDRAIFDEHSPLRQGLTIYQMIPAPVVQGDRLDKGVVAGWAKTELSERLEGGAGEVPQKSSFVMGMRRKLRIRQRLRSLLQGTRCLIVPHG